MMRNIKLVLLLTLLLFPVTAWSALEAELITAVRNNDSAKVEELVKKGANIDSPDDQGTPPLIRAAEMGLADMILQLMTAGADVNVRDKHGRTPLMIAAEKGNSAIVILLLEAGADLSRTDENGFDAFNYAKGGSAPDIITAKLVEYGEPRNTKLKARDLSSGEAGRDKYFSVPVYYATNRKVDEKSRPKHAVYTAEPDKNVHFGVCEVSIPAIHLPGELESPSILRLEFSPNKEKHVVLQKAVELEEKEFFRTIKRDVGNKDILVFIHDYNVSFEKAARRTAQLVYDLQFGGVPLFFSWPSNGNLLKYSNDADKIRQSIPTISQFIATIINRFKPERIHVIAHSMGTYGLTQALAKLSDTSLRKQNTPVFNQLVLAAPDIDAEVFQKEIAPKITRLANRVSLYASSKDLAMTVSRRYNNGKRAGDSEPEILTLKGIDSVDVSRIDSSLVGHSYYGSNSSIITDIRMVLFRKKIEERKLLEPHDNVTTHRRYWLFKPPQETIHTEAAEDDLL
jgi:esterase/lipase superfamily enzyme